MCRQVWSTLLLCFAAMILVFAVFVAVSFNYAISGIRESVEQAVAEGPSWTPLFGAIAQISLIAILIVCEFFVCSAGAVVSGVNVTVGHNRAIRGVSIGLYALYALGALSLFGTMVYYIIKLNIVPF